MAGGPPTLEGLTQSVRLEYIAPCYVAGAGSNLHEGWSTEDADVIFLVASQ